MIYKNAEFHNVAELIQNDDSSVSWMRMPQYVKDNLDSEGLMVYNSTGVEIRFVLKGEKAVIRMSTKNSDCGGLFHIYRGAIQGGWQDHEVHKFVTDKPEEFEISRSENINNLKFMTKKAGYNWSPEVVRIIFDRGYYKIYDIIGDIEPPKKEDKPTKTILSYGSSITHGSNSLTSSHSWVSMLAHNLKMDARNLGMAGTCRLESAVADYIAAEGEAGNWDIATLELGINVLGWNESLITEKSEYFIKEIAIRNPQKEIFVISPFCFYGDDIHNTENSKNWRRILKEIVERFNFPNVTYINGADVIGDSSLYISADEVHPNIYGCLKIAEVLTEKIKSLIEK